MRSLPAGLACLCFVLVIASACVALEPKDGVPTPAATGVPSASSTAEPVSTTLPLAIETATPQPTGRVTLNAVGDLMLERRIITLMDEYGSQYPFEEVLHLLNDADITIGNMEGTFTERGPAANKYYTFRTPPRHAVGLAQAGFDIVSLGNNHAMDYGEVGLLDTMEALDAAGVLHSGAGRNEAEARSPAFIERNGLRLAFLSYNEAVLWEAFPAGLSTPGVALADEAAIREDVALARQQADLVIVSLHSGLEYFDRPTEVQMRLSRAAIDAGAALVLGHHAHVLQGWQRYGDGVIVYGLGNFVFDLYYSDIEELSIRPFLSAVLHFELTAGGVESVTARPVFIDPAEARPVPATGERLRQIETHIQSLNDSLP